MSITDIGPPPSNYLTHWLRRSRSASQQLSRSVSTTPPTGGGSPLSKLPTTSDAAPMPSAD